MGDQFIKEEEGEEKPWDKFFRQPPPEIDPQTVEAGWKPLFEGRRLEDGLTAAAAELVSDLLWGNLALPISKCLEKLQRIDQIYAATGNEADKAYLDLMSERIEGSITDIPNEAANRGLNNEQYTEELLLRRECREMLELSTQQLEEMCEKKVRAHAAQARTHSLTAPRPPSPTDALACAHRASLATSTVSLPPRGT